MSLSLQAALGAFAFLVLALAAPTAMGAAPPVKPATAIDGALTLHDGVVIDAASGQIFMMSPAGGIDAVSTDGTVVWHSDAAAKPLAATAGVLVAQADASDRAGELRLVALDIRSGATSFGSTVALPEQIHGTAVDHLGKSFRVDAASHGNGLVLTWKSIETPRQGYLPAESESLAPALAGKALSRAGSYRLDLGSGGASPLAKSAVSRSSNLRQLDSPLKGLAGRQFLSLDGRHVLATQPRIGEGRTIHRWTIYDLESGGIVGSVERPVGASPFFVAGQTLIHVTQPMIARQGEEWLDEPLMVRAFDLTSGLELWTKEAEDTAFRGPFPP